MFCRSMLFLVFFFFKQKTAYEMRISDWSSDVCSSDLSDGIVTLTMEVTTDFLEGPLLTVEFTGGGGASGEAAMRGVLKPAGFGTMENIEPVWFDTTRWIGCIDGYGNTTAITKLMERSEEHTSELQSIMRISYAVFCLK